jgi:hypothetical protein
VEGGCGFAAKYGGQGGTWSCVVVEVSGEGVFGGGVVVDGVEGSGEWVGGSVVVDGVMDVGGVGVGGLVDCAGGWLGNVICVDGYCL